MNKRLTTLALSTLLVLSLFAQERDRRPDPKKAAQPKIEKVNWDQVKERIEGAVKRGDMTRKEADQKYTELKKSLEAKSQGNRNQSDRARPGSSPQISRQRRPDALGRLVGELVAQGEINRDDARRIIEAANASRPPMQNRPNTHSEIGKELRDILNQARHELAELQEAREELHREHEEWEHHRNGHAQHEERDRHRDEHAQHEERDHHRNEHAEHEERDHHRDEHAQHEEREHHRNERAERENAERREQAEIMRKLAAEEKEERLIETKKRQLERYELELKKRAENLDEKRRQFEKEKRENEKEKKGKEKRG
ncbi:MAG: hypothetical protein P8I39_05070 [Akkermansiaceae bacterium]|nr:hypothetical protein [Akkermansiaceae bacterium]